MEVETLSLYLWMLSSFIGLAIGSYYDWKSRLIPDKVWLVQLLGGGIGLILWALSQPQFIDIILVTFNILTGLILAVVIAITGSMAGGDIKGIFVTSVSFPIMFSLFMTDFVLPELFPSIFSILLNFFLIYVLIALSIFSYNFSRLVRGEDLFMAKKGTLSQQLKLLFEGLYVTTNSLTDRAFYNPGEILIDDGWALYTPSFDGMMTDDEFDALELKEREEINHSIRQTDKKKIWIRPQIPGISVLFLSYVLTITVGTILGPIFNLLVSN